MLRAGLTKRRLSRTAIFAVLLTMLASCNSKKEQEETFSLYINGKSYGELTAILKGYALRHGYNLTLEELPKGVPANRSRHVMIEGNGSRTLIQSALTEQCQAREGRREVEYSRNVFDVNVFTISYFQSESDLSTEVDQLKNTLIKSGFRVVTRAESCDLL